MFLKTTPGLIGITYDIEPFTEGWILNDGSTSPLRGNLSIQSSNPIENFKYNIVDLVKTTPYEAKTIIWNNVDNILDAAADNEVDPQIVAGVIMWNKPIM